MEEKFKGLGGSEEMLSFLEAGTLGTKQMLTNKIKLVFIGDGGVGKTSIIKSFKRDAKFLPGIIQHVSLHGDLQRIQRETETSKFNVCNRDKFGISSLFGR